MVTSQEYYRAGKVREAMMTLAEASNLSKLHDRRATITGPHSAPEASNDITAKCTVAAPPSPVRLYSIPVILAGNRLKIMHYVERSTREVFLSQHTILGAKLIQ